MLMKLQQVKEHTVLNNKNIIIEKKLCHKIMN